MAGVRSLVDLCMTVIADEVNGKQDDYFLSDIYELPWELLDCLLMRLTPLALEKLQEKWPLELNSAHNYGYNGQGRKRKRRGVLDVAWNQLYSIRWPCSHRYGESDNEEDESVDDWRQEYWGRHLQDCVDTVAETALLPSYSGSVGEIKIQDRILERIGYKDLLSKSTSSYLKFSCHCIKFANYARSMKLPNPLFFAETCDLVRCCKLVNLEIQWIKSNDDVDGLCTLLKQNKETLKSVYFIHCKLSPSSIDAICDSLQMKDLQLHGVEHFTIKRSSLAQTDLSPMLPGFASFLCFGKHLVSLTLCDAHLGRNFAWETLNCLLNTPTSISALDLSENDISGSFSRLKCIPGKGRPQLLLRVLNLRACNLEKEDIYSLKKHTLVHLPNLQDLDLSDNLIGDGIRSLIVYFSETTNRDLPFCDLKLENCGLYCNDVAELLEVLSNMKKPLNLISIKGNRLGSQFGSPFGKFLCTGIRSLDIGYVGLGSSGFVEAAKEITKEIEIEHIDISNNVGRIEAARFVSMVVSHARKQVAVYARDNLMPAEALSIISQGFRTAKGKVKHLNLLGNSFSSVEIESFKGDFVNGCCTLEISSLNDGNEAYDYDP